MLASREMLARYEPADLKEWRQNVYQPDRHMDAVFSETIGLVRQLNKVTQPEKKNADLNITSGEQLPP